MVDYTWLQWFLVFLIYAIIGWCVEVSYAALKDGEFVNRGFLNGPVCPIYGFGGAIVIGCLYAIRAQFVLVFFGAVVLTTVLEFLTGFALDKIFHEHWWDYSKEHFNIKGYVCLRFSILWGLSCVMVVDVVHPPIDKFVLWVPENIQFWIFSVVATLFAVDMFVTVSTIVEWKRSIRIANSIAKTLHSFSDEVGDSIAETVLKTITKGTEMKEAVEQIEKYQEVCGELSEKKQELEKLYHHAARLRKIQNTIWLRRIKKAFPSITVPGVDDVKARITGFRKKGIHEDAE